MTVRPTTSVVIRSYTEERWEYLTAALQSVQEQTSPALEAIVVIDHNPELLARVQTSFPDVVAVENQFERGSSGAWNSGVAATKGEVIAFLDDDALAEPDWLERLGTGYGDPDVVGVGGAIEPVWLKGKPRWFPEEFYWIVSCTYRGMPEIATPVRNLIGCNMSFRRHIFDELGAFRNDLGHKGKRPIGGDETELCIRILKRWPYKVLLHEPKAKVSHMVPSARSGWSYFCWRCYLEGQSKARLSRLVGKDVGLSSERAYAFKTLPRGIMRGVADVMRRSDPAGIGRAGAIVAGLTITIMGYLVGTVSLHLEGRKQAAELDVDRI